MLLYVIAAVVAVVGAIFIGQGLGYIGGSRMTNDPFWAAVGAGLMIGAAVLVIIRRRSSRS